MPRKPRIAPHCGTFHIYFRGNNKRCVFRRESEFRHFKKLLLTYKERFDFLLYHYVLMKNHIHLSLKATEKTNISKLMQGISISYNYYHRKRYSYVGHLWQGRFNSKNIEDDKYLLALGLYIEKNPVEAGLVKDPADYAWGSYRYYAFGEKDSLVDQNPLYENLGKTNNERQKIYRNLMASRIEEKCTPC